MSKSAEGSTGKLLQLCLGYFSTYVIFGIATKWFTETSMAMHQVQYLVYSSVGGSIVCLSWVFLHGWWKRPEGQDLKVLSYIIPSGICTAVVIPTTTMMYLLPISVMVAMVIMRAGVIVIGRVVDGIQIRQGLLHKKVYWQENVGVLFALIATGTILLYVDPAKDFNFLHNTAAMTILTSYLVAYGIRIYIMNYYKNTRPPGAPMNNNWYFAVEQLSASVGLILIAAFVIMLPQMAGWSRPVYDLSIVEQVKAAAKDPIESLYVFRHAFVFDTPNWGWAAAAGAVYGIGAFFSVFIFMFKGRTATFANLVNRLTSLVAGTTATVLFALLFGGKYPKPQDWVSLGFIFAAVGFLTLAEKRRVAELKATHELEEREGHDRRTGEERRHDERRKP